MYDLQYLSAFIKNVRDEAVVLRAFRNEWAE
jgi:hypothetical protein